MKQLSLKPGDTFIPYKMFRGVFIPNGIVQMKNLPATAKLVYGVLNRYAGKDGKCFPKQTTIANDVGISRRRIITHLNYLEKAKLIQREKPKGEDKLLHKATRYVFLFHECFLSKDDETVMSECDVSITSGPDGSDTSIIGSIEIGSLEKISSKEEISDPDGIAGTSVKKLVKRKKLAKKSSADKMRGKKKSLEREVPQREPPKISSKIAPFIEYWESQGLIKHDRTSKTFAEAVKYLNKLVSHGTLFNNMTDFEEFADVKLSFGDFTTSVDNYIKSRSPEYLPIDKKWLNYSLSNFLYNPYGKNGRTKSSLIYFLLNPPEPIVDNKYPEITHALVKQFADWNPNYKPTDKDKLKFVQAGNRTGDFFVKHKNKIVPHFKLDEYKQAQLLIRAVKTDTQDKGWLITPGYLCSNTTFDHRLPMYLKSQAVFSSVDRKRFR